MSTTRTNSSFFLGAVATVVALVAAMGALLLLAYDANPARAAGECSTTSGTTTCTFGSTGGEQTFVVPAGVSSVKVVATGAPGAKGYGGDGLNSPAPGGYGSVVSGSLTGLETGDTLYVNVGGAATNAGSNTCYIRVACNGGFNGGGSSLFFGGGGGGASDVRYISRDRSGSLASRLIVAAGGGGSGQNGTCSQAGSSLALKGGMGGWASPPVFFESDGSEGDPCSGPEFTIRGGEGGKTGTQSAGGAGGSPDGRSGSLGQGGNGGTLGGGGGGGGLYGGGGGGSSTTTPQTGNDSISGGGGGGGGFSLVPPGGSALPAKYVTVPPSVTISYQAGGVGEEPPVSEPPQQRCTITGTTGADALRGTSRDDVICGLGGADSLIGGGGKDVLRGGGGPDALLSSDGVRRNDTMNGGRGKDSCVGDQGDVKRSC